VGLAETKNFADGYDAIFGAKSPSKKAARPKAAKSKGKSKKKAREKKK
jgi:hypothetical protein